MRPSRGVLKSDDIFAKDFLNKELTAVLGNNFIFRLQKQGFEITWEQDDILDTRLDRQFDLIFDRGCFHVLEPERREDYVRTVSGLLKTGGYMFLKCFSRLEPGEQGPYRFTPEQIRELFGGRLNVLSIKETVYQGTLVPLPRALFCAMRREG